MDKITLLRAFWDCGENDIIEFAIHRARLNKDERTVCCFILDDCYSQEKTAELLGYSVRWVQKVWRKASDKLINIPWVMAYAKSLSK